MATLSTLDGKTVDAGASAAAAVDAKFSQVMNDDGPDPSAPPRRPETPAPADDKPKARRGRPPKAEQARTTTAPAASLDDAQRAAGVVGLVQIGAGAVLMAGRATGNGVFYSDAAAIATASPAIADACVQVAKHDARFAAALDKVCSSGPYAALVTVGVSLGMQLLRNHRPGLSLPGTVDPVVLLTVPKDDSDAPAA